MTDTIEWGEVIEVSGRPGWLQDDENCLPRWGARWYSDSSGAPADCVFGWETVTAIKLPADHPAYIGYTKKPQLVTEEASEPLQSANSTTAPANHGPTADDKVEAGDFIPCERTVRMCIGALPDLTVGHPNFRDGVRACIFELDALLPKPDRAEELVNGYVRDVYPNWGHVWAEGAVADKLKFARWLIERGEIKG